MKKQMSKKINLLRLLAIFTFFLELMFDYFNEENKVLSFIIKKPFPQEFMHFRP